MRDLLCAIVYGSRGGLKGVAADIDHSPSELSRMLNREQDDPRKLDINDFIGILQSTGDTRPVQWLIEKFLHNPEQQKAMAAQQLALILPAIIELAQQAGVSVKRPKRG